MAVCWKYSRDKLALFFIWFKNVESVIEYNKIPLCVNHRYVKVPCFYFFFFHVGKLIKDFVSITDVVIVREAVNII